MTTTTYPRLTMMIDFYDADDEPIREYGVLFWDADHDTWTVTGVYGDTFAAYGSTWSCADPLTAIAAWRWSMIDDAGAISQDALTITAEPDGCPDCGGPVDDSGTTNPCATRYTCRACGWNF